MALQAIAPVSVAVTAHWRTGIPQAVAFSGITRRVTKLLALRREGSVYQASAGPRTLFEVETEDATLVLSYARRTRSWAIEAYDDAWATLPFASTIEVPSGVLAHA